MRQPINEQLNKATHYIASHIFPLGFDVHAPAPNTYGELKDLMNHYGRMAIWSGDYSSSCFGDSETWWQFRAWHDWVHYRFGAGFDMPGEHTACHIQAGQLMRLYGRTDDVIDMIALVFCNIIGPLEQGMAGRPVADVHAYCEAQVDGWKAYARKLVAEQGRTDQDAIDYSRQAYHLRDTAGPPVPWQARPASEIARLAAA